MGKRLPSIVVGLLRWLSIRCNVPQEASSNACLGRGLAMKAELSSKLWRCRAIEKPPLVYASKPKYRAM